MLNSDDRFVKELQVQKEALEACQDSKKVDSCIKCESLVGCEVRNKYVKSVYDSMSHGETGGFEF